MNDRFYITTPIYYVNDVPHLGHAYTTIVADTFARYYRDRLGQEQTLFVTGTDEHGQKIERAAEQRGIAPIELADQVVERFRALWERLGIANDDFIRTTEDRHKHLVQRLWRAMKASGDIVEGSYSGWYCVGCEAYYTEKEIGEARQCPVGHGDVEFREEPSYFFRLSAYQQPLLDLYDRADPPFVVPGARLNEVRSFVAGGLQDLSVSRSSIRWGIPVPDDPEHVIYVWLDALSNYVSVLMEPDPSRFQRFWPADIHLIGKDILRFHAVYWPAFLMSAAKSDPDFRFEDGSPKLPWQVVSHGWWTVEGQKMSKSLANVVDPNFLIDEYGRDVVRYFVLREVPLGADGDFSHRNLLMRLNADLANDLGNLLSRTLGMLVRYRNGAVPDGAVDEDLFTELAPVDDAIAQAMDVQRQPNLALEALWRWFGRLNQYVDEQAPWTLAKEGRDTELDKVLRTLLDGIAAGAQRLAPFMPDTAAAMLGALGAEEGAVVPGKTLERPQPLFPRLDSEQIEQRLEKIAAMTTDTEQTPDAPTEAMVIDTPEIAIDTFFESDLRVGEVLAAEAVPKSKKLLKLQVTLGEAEPRTIVSGIAKSYTPEDMVGRRVVVVANLKPAKLMGIESQGMILAGATADGGLRVIEPAAEIPVGTRIS
ncbi:MAG: methionine--tRNA ligase [Candidatus Dadabacteria bacterium]|nr:MAG: methionine--tRNA ligase [Candidatus Dadabacteria bacterium]